mmetsp:Transcript_49120/g.116972  ORF Transcript_49120/g.116972 Transcript_49120/m.116972 type:complete len:1086 (+) Transcript_49120:122-3379(+)
MEVTVSIQDSRHLSQSELITRNLFTVLQLGSSTSSGARVLVPPAKLEAGSADDELVITVKNRQTETIMYIRNVPVAAALSPGGAAIEQWIALYSPGDPQNNTFDPAVPPKEGCPQVLLRLSAADDTPVVTNATSPMAFRPSSTSLMFAPAPREYGGAANTTTAAIGGRSSEIDAAMAEWRLDPVVPPTTDSSNGANLLPNVNEVIQDNPAAQPGTVAGVSKADEDAIRAKVLRVKEHLIGMAGAQQRAQDLTRSLQESERIRDDLRSQLEEMQIQLRDRKAACEVLREERQTLRATVDRLRAQADERQKTDNLHRTARASRLEETLSSAAMKEAQLQAELQAAEARQDESVKDMDAKLTEVKAQTQALFTTMSSEGGRASGLEEQIDLAEETEKEVVIEIEETKVRKQAAAQELEEAKGSLSAKEGEVASLKGQLEEWEVEATQLTAVGAELKTEVAQLEAQIETAQKSAIEVEELRQQRGRLEKDMARIQDVQGLEGKLQKLRDSLAAVREAVHQRTLEEEETRLEVAALQDSVKMAEEKLEHQDEHGHLQFEALQRLQEEKQRFDTEVEMLTLGLHEADQRNEFLQENIALMQQEVGGLNSNALVDWGAGAREAKLAQLESDVGKVRDEIAAWKLKAENLRGEKQMKLAAFHKQNEDSLQAVRKEIQRIKSDISSKEQRLRRLTQKEKARTEAVMPGVPGLMVVPQRPLPERHDRRRALLVGANYTDSHAPLKGCVNDTWNLQCLFRYTLQYTEEQLRVLLDGVTGCPSSPSRAPTKANILAGLEWLVTGARPGDVLVFAFSGYGAQHPASSTGSESCEAHVVPCDFAADLPPDFFTRRQKSATITGGTSPGGTAMGSPTRTGGSMSLVKHPGPNAAAKPPEETFAGRYSMGPSQQSTAMPAVEGYRLLSMSEIREYVVRLPAGCHLTIVFDCCYSVMHDIAPRSSVQATFPKVERGFVDYQKLRDFISRPRFLELPPLPVPPRPRTPAQVATLPACSLYCYSACKMQEWCAEFPIEGTVQGAYSWAFLKALAQGQFHVGVYQFQRTLTSIILDLRKHFKGVEQTPVLQLSQSASMQDIVLKA